MVKLLECMDADEESLVSRIRDAIVRPVLVEFNSFHNRQIVSLLGKELKLINGAHLQKETTEELRGVQ